MKKLNLKPVMFSLSSLVVLQSVTYAQRETVFSEEDKKIADQILTYNERTKSLQFVRSEGKPHYTKYDAQQVNRSTQYAAVKTGVSSTPVPWPGCECKSPTVLAQYNFENVASGSTVASVAPSSFASGFATPTNIAGPGSVAVNSVTTPLGTSNWGCFGGFSSSGTTDTIGFSLTNNSGKNFCLHDVTFDFFSEGNSKNHGITEFYVILGDGTNQFWQSQTVSGFGYGAASAQSFSLFGQSGNVLTLDPDWMELSDGESLQVQIFASGANSILGMDLDNVTVEACEKIPEPTSTFLVASGSLLLLLRRKK